MIREAISALVEGKSLSVSEASAVMEEIMEGQATAAQLGAFLTALRIKGETAEEIAGLASVMRTKATRVTVSYPVLDIVGTGGDGLNTFNISTSAALVAAGAGIKVAKHGNRAASSKCGSADVLEALGVKIDLTAEQVQYCIEKVGIGFMFAPMFHPSMKYAAVPRKEIGIRSVFNILGPLTNPAQAEFQVLGVPNHKLAEKIAETLCQLGIKHALVVQGLNGMDEISISGKSWIWEIMTKQTGTRVVKYCVYPSYFGLDRAPISAIAGATPAENAAIIHAVFSGEKGARRNVVLMNAAAGLVAGNKAANLQQGVSLSGEVIDSGKALAKLNELIQLSQSFARSRQ